MQIHKILFCFRDVRCLLFYNSDLVRTLMVIYDLGCDCERISQSRILTENNVFPVDFSEEEEENTNLHS